MQDGQDRFQAMRDESRERLMDAALHLFARDGYVQTSVRRIAQEAGVSQGLMYNYFASKEAMLGEIFAREMRDVEESFAAMRRAGTPAERLGALLRASLEIVQREAPFWRLLYGLRFQRGVLDELGDEIARWSTMVRADLEALLCELGAADPVVEARVLFALIDGLAQHVLLDAGHFPVEAAIAAIEARYARAPA